jgi:hypothetical protein
MPVYYSDKEKTHTVNLKPVGYWKSTEIYFDGIHLDTVATREDLRNGKQYEPMPGMHLSVRLVKKGIISELPDIRLNGQSFIGSASDQERDIRTVIFGLFFLGGIYLFRAFRYSMREDFPVSDLTMGITIFAGILLICLAVILKITRSPVPLVIALIYLTAEMTLMVAGSQSDFSRMPLVPFFINILYIVWFIRGIKAVNNFRRDNERLD